jgi:glycosyltransferase involved in cell wall biosynthesis
MPPRATAVLVTRTLGRGGVEAVVAALARDLPAHGIDVIVVCERGGVTADELRAGGVAVRECSDEGDVAAVLARVEGPRVVELHNAPSYAVVACRRMGVPHVPVVHTTDINLNPSQWMAAADVLADAPAAVAVSATVRDFTLAGLPPSLGDVFTVIPNGVDPLAISATDRARARAGLSDALGAELGEHVVALCLARYDMQKNIPGLVAAFLRSTGTDAILVVAGPVEDWLEHRLAHALAVAQGAEHRVRLLGTSSSSALLAAADVFVLDSFFEGWPVAVTEAAVAGIPLVVAEVGGTRELVGESGERGRRVANPGGNPRTITLREIRRARRHVRRQANSTAFADAFDEVIADIEEWRLRRDDLAADARERFGSSAMVAKHAGLVMEIAGLSTAAEPVLQGEGKST